MGSFQGTAGDDTVTGTANGANTNDTLQGLAGNDTLIGGDGADALDGGTGIDFASYADAPAGVVANLVSPGLNTGYALGDTYTSIEGLIGSNSNDTLTGDSSNNLLRGGLGADVLDGGAGSDTADYFGASAGLLVSLANPAGNTGEAAGDTYTSIENIRGSAFNDTLIGDGNNNTLRGGLGADSLDGGAGFDFVSYADSTTAITASLANPASNTGEAAGDTYVSIEAIRGSDFNDSLTGDANINFLQGGVGADTLDGGAGFDFADYFNASTAIVANLSDASANTGEAAGDVYVGIEGLRGGAFNDLLVGDNNGNYLRGGLGADTLNGGGGRDVADYGNASAGIVVNLNNPSLNTGEAAGDVYVSIEGIQGSNFNDTLIGDATADTLFIGGLGADSMVGGSSGIDAASYISATSGVTASLANPAVNTGEATGDSYSGIEVLIGSAFADHLIGDAGNNPLDGRGGADTLDGGAGFDTASYDQASASVVANLADSSQNTGDAAGDVYSSIEALSGSRFNDTLVGDANDNILSGGLGADALNGGAGNDIASYSRASSAVVASLANPAANTGEASGDIYTSIEGLDGSSFNDTLTGDGGNNVLRGGGGNDSLDGGSGTDTAWFFGNRSAYTITRTSPTSSVLVAGEGFDTLTNIELLHFFDVTLNVADLPIANTGTAGADNLYGGVGNDSLVGLGGNDVLIGFAGDDVGYGGDGNDYFYAGSGNDILVGDAGLDVLLGEAGNDSLYGGSGTNYLFGGDGNDLIIGNGGIVGAGDVNVMFGEAGADALYGGAGFNYFYGGAGVDTMFGGSGLNIFVSSGETDGNVIYGGAGQNYVYGSNGGDTVTGGASVDVFLMGSGADNISGGGGVDYAWGGGGADTFSISDTTSGVMVIQDFNTGGVNDFLSFAGTSLHSFADVQAAETYVAGINTTIITDAAGNAAWLIGIAPGQLDASMFKFS
ncbi:calcium-binding protein [Bradyrhizobium sp. 26S5]|uniref:beta strand repeat-containing protein n=1 Tax=Bradyrhizobium sp. 26S5 TaxID=3139729 RepID=UPI0030CE6B57